MRYRVEWKSKLTGKTGHGEWTSKECAYANADRANRELPDIEHVAVPEKEPTP